MKKHTRNAAPFTAAMLITLLVAVGGCAALLALSRMENTMSPESYTVFSLEKKGNRCALTALGKEYELELPADSPSWREAVPDGVRLFLLAAGGLMDALGEFIGSL